MCIYRMRGVTTTLMTMHVALFANTAWLDDELTTFQQLTVGLVDEQVQITRVVPASVVARSDRGSDTSGPTSGGLGDSPLFGRRMTWSESAIAAIDHRRVVKLCEKLATAEVDLVHALHGDLWQPVAVIAEELDVPAVFTASSTEDVRLATRLMRQVQPTRCVFAATTDPIAAELRVATQKLVMVETVQPGVHVSDPSINPRQPGEAMCVAVCGDGMMDEQYQAMLDGLAEFVLEQPQVQFFFDGQRTDQHQVWKAVRRMGLLPNVSFVPRRLGHREMLLMADAIIHPQRCERSRGVTLLAMAHAVPVLALADPYVDYLVDDHTAWLIHESTGDAWAEMLRRLINHPDDAADLGLRARAWVHEERLASDQIERVLTLYRNITGAPLPFPG